METEDKPLGKGTFLHDAIGPHGTSEFCNRLLGGGLGEADKKDTNYVEAYELLQHMQRKKQVRRRTPGEWIIDTINDLLTPTQDPEDTASDSETDEEPVESNPEDPWEDPPEH